MINGVIYARYSSERQTEQSIEGQLTVCNRYARDNNINIVQVYIDRAMTGTNDNRAEFQRMLRDSALKQWEVVLVYKGDRFSRNRYESAIHKKTLKDNGVRLVSATELIPETPEGVLMESLLEGMAEYYSLELSQKVKRGLAESKKKGQWTGGSLPFGYDICDKKPVINKHEAMVVRDVFKAYSSGKTAKMIAKNLDERGIRKKNGKPLTATNIFNLLHNERLHGEDGIFPKIIDDDLWSEVQRVNAVNKRAPARRKAHEKFLLSGKLYCGECGGSMTGETGTSSTGRVYSYYKCFEKKKHTKNCTFPSIPKDDIEDAVFNVCVNVLNAKFIQKVAEEAFLITQEAIGDNTNIIAIEKAIAENKKARDNLLKALETGLISETVTNRIFELEKEISVLTCRLESEKQAQGAIRTKEDYANFLYSFLQKNVTDLSLKQELFEMFIQKVVVFRDKICVTFNFSPDGNDDLTRSYFRDKEMQEIIQEGASSFKDICSKTATNNYFERFPEFCVFFKRNCWGVWVKFQAKKL